MIFDDRDRQSAAILAQIFDRRINIPYLRQIPEVNRRALFHAILESSGTIDIDRRFEAIQNLCDILTAFSDPRNLRVTDFLNELHASSTSSTFQPSPQIYRTPVFWCRTDTISWISAEKPT
jgi:hypothetical protein